MTSSIQSALSGVLIGTARLGASAANVANANGKGAIPDMPPGQPIAGNAASPAPYQPIQTVRQTVGADGSGGVTYSLQPVLPSYAAQYDPTAVYADSRGLVAAPNVDFTKQSAEQMEALQAYRLNVQVLRIGDETVKSLLDLKA